MKKRVDAERNVQLEQSAMKRENVSQIKPKKSRNAKRVKKSIQKPVDAERNARLEQCAMKKEFVLKIKPKKSRNAKRAKKSILQRVGAGKCVLQGQ
jgi:hypothetical protein